MLLTCLPAEAKIYFLRPLKEAKFPLPYSLNFVTIKLFYRIAIEQLAKCVREEGFQFCLIWSHIDRCERDDGCILVVFFIFFCGGGGKGSRSLPITSLSTRLLVVNRFLSVEELINTWIHLQFSCHKEPEKFSRVQLSETSICRWSLLLLRSFWFPGKSPQAAQEWNREGLEEIAIIVA